MLCNKTEETLLWSRIFDSILLSQVRQRVLIITKFPLVIRSYSAVRIQRLERTDQDPGERVQLEKCPACRLEGLRSIPLPTKNCHAWWHALVIPVFGWQRQEDLHYWPAS